MQRWRLVNGGDGTGLHCGGAVDIIMPYQA